MQSFIKCSLRNGHTSCERKITNDKSQIPNKYLDREIYLGFAL